jgi:hypothetical protein
MRSKKRLRSSLKLSPSDRIIWAGWQENGYNPNVLTEWYFNGWTCKDHPKQHAWLSARGYTEKYLATGARFGKTEGAAVELLLDAMEHPESIVCNTSITQDQAEIGWNFAVGLALSSPRLEHWIADVQFSPFPKLILAHGGEFWARSTQNRCKHLRSHKFRRINYDEISYGNEDDMEVLLMRLADTGGTFSGTTTPKGKGWFFRSRWRPAQDEMRNAEAENRPATMLCIAGTSYDNPHISHDYLDRVRLTKRGRAQEVMGVFLDNEDNPFTEEAIKGVTNPDFNLEFDTLMERYAADKLTDKDDKRLKEGRYVVAYDIAKRVDWTVGGAMRVSGPKWRMCFFERFQRKPWPQVRRHMEVAQARHHGDLIFDATGVGDPTYDDLRIALPRLIPFVFTPKSKNELITNLQYCMEHKLFEMPFIKQLQDELYGYEWDDKNITETDSVMMLALLCWAANTERPAMEVI